MGRIEPARGRALAYYDFAVDGGAVGSIPLRGDKIPSGAIITSSLMYVDAAPTSGGAATVAITVESAGDIQAAAAISGAPWSTTGAKRGTLTEAAAPVVTTAERTITAVVGTAELTAGRFRVLVEYVELP